MSDIANTKREARQSVIMSEQQIEQAIDGYGLDDSQFADDHGTTLCISCIDCSTSVHAPKRVCMHNSSLPVYIAIAFIYRAELERLLKNHYCHIHFSESIMISVRPYQNIDALIISCARTHTYTHTSKAPFEAEDKQTFLVMMIALEMLIFNFLAMLVIACAI